MTESENANLDNITSWYIEKKIMPVRNDLNDQLENCTTPKEKVNCQKINEEISLLDSVQSDLNAFVADSPAGSTLLKALMCSASNMGIHTQAVLKNLFALNKFSVFSDIKAFLPFGKSTLSLHTLDGQRTRSFWKLIIFCSK